MRVYRILICVMRCERVIQEDDAPKNDLKISRRRDKVTRDRAQLDMIRSRVQLDMIRSRAQLDMKLTNKRLGKGALPLKLVKATWAKTGLIAD